MLAAASQSTSLVIGFLTNSKKWGFTVTIRSSNLVIALLLTIVGGVSSAVDIPQPDPNTLNEESAPDSNVAVAQPEMNFATQTHDFGRVVRGNKVSYRFKFTNSGDGALVIHGVHASCGCTAVETERSKTYGPGQSGFVEVTLDTANFSGNMNKIVTVMTNQKLRPDRTLAVKATVAEEIAAWPPIADIGEVAFGATGETQVRVKSIGTPVPSWLALSSLRKIS
jgi:hypothetical protein